MSALVLSGLVWSCLVVSGLVWSGLVWSGLMFVMPRRPWYCFNCQHQASWVWLLSGLVMPGLVCSCPKLA